MEWRKTTEIAQGLEHVIAVSRAGAGYNVGDVFTNLKMAFSSWPEEPRTPIGFKAKYHPKRLRKASRWLLYLFKTAAVYQKLFLQSRIRPECEIMLQIINRGLAFKSAPLGGSHRAPLGTVPLI